MYLVFDIGGTNMKIATSPDGKILTATKIVSTPQDFEEGIKAIKQIASKLRGNEKIEAVAGGVAGPIDKEKSKLVASPHIPGWIEKPLKQSIEEAFNSPVLLEHEADLEGLGETVLGAGAGYKIVATLIIGTGVASTRTVEGKIDQNALGFEAGHHIIIVDGNQCDCGGKGHFEAYVSGSGIQRTYGKKGEEIMDPKIWDEVAKYIAIGLNNVTVFWSPDAIVLGGAVMKSVTLDAVRSYFNQTLTIFPAGPEIIQAKLGDLATLYGALVLLDQKTMPL